MSAIRTGQDTVLAAARAALVHWMLRGSIIAAGGVALLVTAASWSGPVVVLLALGALLVVAAAVAPGGAAPAAAIVVLLAAWFAVRHGAHTPAAWRTAVYALALYLLHAMSAFAGAVPAGADVDAGAVVRWGRRQIAPVAVIPVVALAAGGLRRVGGSLTLVLLGLAAAAVLAALPVLLLRGRR